MIKNVNGREVSGDDSVKTRCHLGATTDDIIDYVRPTVRKKPDMTSFIPVLMTFKIKLTHFKKLESHYYHKRSGC